MDPDIYLTIRGKPQLAGLYWLILVVAFLAAGNAALGRFGKR